MQSASVEGSTIHCPHFYYQMSIVIVARQMSRLYSAPVFGRLSGRTEGRRGQGGEKGHGGSNKSLGLRDANTCALPYLKPIITRAIGR